MYRRGNCERKNREFLLNKYFLYIYQVYYFYYIWHLNNANGFHFDSNPLYLFVKSKITPSHLLHLLLCQCQCHWFSDVIFFPFFKSKNVKSNDTSWKYLPYADGELKLWKIKWSLRLEVNIIYMKFEGNNNLM